MVDKMAAVRALVLPLLACLSLHCAAAPFSVRLGEVPVVLDAPAGFADTLDLASPRLQALAEGLTSASNRILLFALTDADLRRFTVGDSPELRRYLLLATPRALERESIGLSQFRKIAADAAANLGQPASPGNLRAFLDSQPVGQANYLAELQRTPLMVSLLIGTRLPPREGKPQYLLNTTTLLLLRGKQLVASAYAEFGEELDDAWLRALTRGWIDELQRLNAR